MLNTTTSCSKVETGKFFIARSTYCAPCEDTPLWQFIIGSVGSEIYDYIARMRCCKLTQILPIFFLNATRKALWRYTFITFER